MEIIREIFYQIPGMKTVNACWMVHRAKSFPDGQVAIQVLNQRATEDAWRGFTGFAIFFVVSQTLRLAVWDNVALADQVNSVGSLLAMGEFLDGGVACMIFNDAIENSIN